MKFMIGTAALFLILTSAPAFAQDEPKPQQQDEHKPQDSKAPVPEKAPPEKPEAGQPKEKQAPPEKAQPAAKPKTDEKQQQQEQKAQEKQTQEQQKQAQQQQKTQQAQAHNSAPAQNGGNARRIPDDKFRTHFGPQHHFRVARGNNGRFQYGGYWFVYTNPWPVGWSYDDDCYIEDDGGVYYLVDVLHPDLRLVVVVQIS
jgi:flagellar motor protein MotB